MKYLKHLPFSICWAWSRQRRRRGRRPHGVHVRRFEMHGTNGSFLGRVSLLVVRNFVFSYVCCKKGFAHHGCSVALQLLFLKCWTWSRQRRRRGRRPHDVHVRCFEVHGTIHMMAAKSTTWSYLKRAWGNELTFERASRSLAKTGFSPRG